MFSKQQALCLLLALSITFTVAPMQALAEDAPVAPELNGAMAWLNTDAPLRLESLRGNVVLLDFWTYCCINCMHVLPTLRQLERDFADEPFAVIGIHSAKFSEEREAVNIREAIARHDIRHPVAVDNNFEIWRSYGVQAWPTLVLIGADGRIMAQLPGEPEYANLKRMVSILLAAAKHQNIAKDGSPKLTRNPTESHKTPLLYPGKVLPLDDGRLVIADSAHHRLVVLREDGEVLDVVGSGLDGFLNGTFTESAFSRPQGMVEMEPGIIWVADTENHAIRRVDLKDRSVTTLFGDGTKGGRFYSVSSGWNKGGPGSEFRSPWDLERVAGGVAVAMAGSHQLFLLDEAGQSFRVLAGSGRETLTDGPPGKSAFAQPSGLATSIDGKTLYVADSETSSIRAVRLSDGYVKTLIGTGLFDFGDKNGELSAGQLQHPLGVEVLADGTLALADTFNSKLKQLDPEKNWIRPLRKKGKTIDVKEPGGLARKGNKLFVADTNHHRILVFNLADGSIKPLIPKKLKPPALHGGVLDRAR